MILGSVALLKRDPVIPFKLRERDSRASLTSLAFGVLAGMPFAILNVVFFVYGYGQQAAVGDVVFGSFNALLPGIMEEVAYRLLFMSLALSVLLKHLPRRLAVVGSLTMAVLFHSAPYVLDLMLTNPASALVSIVISSVFFGLSMALLAYRKTIESAIGFHWVIDAVQFTLGL
jgi:hypothetical protein